MGISPRVAIIASWRKIWLPGRGISSKQLSLTSTSNYPCLFLEDREKQQGLYSLNSDGAALSMN
ncbi:Uncharacterized protein APZ42_001457 [Daphnia magna]|uniref:Uncharacterized protein n=1 Tax=Daphnia magna TaxID=35525 RepID=A0A164IZ45_9CRUS|nr:Uncharacterized protein APZ42_001457 [Daphnia magna]